MSKENNLTDFLTDLGSAIKDKRGTGNPINAQDFASEVRAIEPLLDTLDITENGLHDVKEYKNVSVLVESEELELIKTLVGNWTTSSRIEIPYGIETIGESAFNRNFGTYKNLQFITVPTSVVEIKGQAFSTAGLIYKGTFEQWLKIKKGTSSNTSASSYQSFANNGESCKSLTVYNNTTNATSVKLTEYTIPNDFTGLERGAFSHLWVNTSADEAILYVNSNVKYIDSGCFFATKGFKEIIFNKNNVVSSNDNYPKAHFMYCKVKKIVLPILEKLYTYMFYTCNNLEQIEIQEGVKIIEDYCFFDNSKLTKLNLPSTLQEIKERAFQGCTTLQELVIPASVTNMNASLIFSGMTGNVVMESSTPCTIGTSTFSSFNGKIYVPKGTSATYKSATNWSKQASKIYERYVVVFNVPSELLNNETITYSVDGGNTYNQFTNGVLNLNDVATIKIKSTDSSQTILIGTSAGANDVGTISNSELTFSFTTDTNVYLTIQ